MNNSLFVCRRQPVRDLDRVINRLARRQRSAHQAVPQIAPLEKFCNQVRRAFMRADIKDGENTGMIQRAGRAGFLFKRRKRSRSRLKELGKTLIATSRPNRGSRARYTSPIPPAPRGETI